MSEGLKIDTGFQTIVDQMLFADDLQLDPSNYKSTTSPQVQNRYSTDMQILHDIFYSTKAPTEEDFGNLTFAMKDLVDLIENGMKGEDGKQVYPTLEMVYNSVVILSTLNQAKVNLTTDLSTQAVMDWKGMGKTEVPTINKQKITLDLFITKAPKVGADPNLIGEVETFVLDKVYNSYMDKLSDLGDASKTTNEILQVLTQILDLANSLKVMDGGDFKFPPTTYTDIEPFLKIYSDFFEGLGDKKYTGSKDVPWWPEGKKDMTWYEAFCAARSYDYDIIQSTMKPPQNLTLEQAQGKATATVDLINAYASDAKNTNVSDLEKLVSSLEDAYFSLELEVSLEKSGQTAESMGAEVIELRNQLEDLLATFGQGPYENNSLPFYLDKVIQDIDRTFGNPPVKGNELGEAFTTWVMDLIKPGSSTYYDLNSAINAAKFLNNQQKQDLQVAMMTFQSLMKMGISMMEDISKTIQSLASKVAGR